VMDQMTSACGEAHHLLALLCQPAELQEIIQIPQEIEFWGLDSGVKHSVSGSDYTRVRAGTFMGYRIITELAGFNQKGTSTDDLYLGGYLSNLTPSEFEHQYARHLPESITGAEFLSRYQWTTDHVTTVEPLENYAVRVPTAHAIYEHFRVRTYAQLLKQLVNERQLELLGELMYQSHASYSACGLGSEGTDLLVKFVRDMGPARGLYGAKITGGGSGGTVVVLGHRNDIAVKAIQDIANRYDRKTKHYPHVFSGSSPGAVRFGCLKVRKDVVNP
jgi:galactokinase